MYITYKFRYYPSPELITIHTRDMDNDRFVYNMGKQWIDEHFELTKKTISLFELQKKLPQLKLEHPRLNETAAQVLQQSIVKIRAAYHNYLLRIQVGVSNAGQPRWKCASDSQSVTYQQYVRIEGSNLIWFPKIGSVEVNIHRPVIGIVKQATILRNKCNQWYICLYVDDGVPAPIVNHNGRVLGIDLGLKHLVVTSDGTKVDAPQFLKKRLDQLAKLQQTLANQTRGSKSYERTKANIVRLHQKIINCRNDFAHKLSRKLVDENQVLVFETLDIPKMLRTPWLAQAIADASWGKVVYNCSYKTKRVGKSLLRAPSDFPSSKRCSCCGRRNKNLRLEDRVWTCPCGAQHDRDLNASINLEQWGVNQIVISALGGCGLPDEHALDNLSGASCNH